MRITALDTFLVAPRWLFLRVSTDEGITGWGEPIVEGRAATVAAAVAELADHLVGQDPRRIEDHWQVLTKGGFYRGGPILSSAVAGIDQALWDIHGKALGQPVHALLGGPVRDSARVYTWIGGDRPNQLAEHAHRAIEAGLTAVKLNATAQLAPISSPAETHAAAERVALLRDAVGPNLDIAIDLHGRASPAMARRLLPLLEPSSPLFVEEPVLPEYAMHLPTLVASSSIPLAVGERLYSRWDFRPPLEAGVAVVQPDVSHAGGISETRRIATLAEIWGAQLAPHCPLGPIALAACLQVAFATPNFLIQELSLGIHYNQTADLLDYLLDRTPLTPKGGHIHRLTGPGLGIQIDEQAVEQAARAGHRWRSPIWRHDDGSFAEW